MAVVFGKTRIGSESLWPRPVGWHFPIAHPAPIPTPPARLVFCEDRLVDREQIFHVFVACRAGDFAAKQILARFARLIERAPLRFLVEPDPRQAETAHMDAVLAAMFAELLHGRRRAEVRGEFAGFELIEENIVRRVQPGRRAGRAGKSGNSLVHGKAQWLRAHLREIRLRRRVIAAPIPSVRRHDVVDARSLEAVDDLGLWIKQTGPPAILPDPVSILRKRLLGQHRAHEILHRPDLAPIEHLRLHGLVGNIFVFEVLKKPGVLFEIHERRLAPTRIWPVRVTRDTLLAIHAEEIFFARVHLASDRRVVRLVAEPEAVLAAQFVFPPRIFQPGEAAAFFTAQEEIDRATPDRLVVVEMNRGERRCRCHILQHDLFQKIRLSIGGLDHEPLFDEAIIGSEPVVQSDFQTVPGEFQFHLAADFLHRYRVLREQSARVRRDGETDARHLISQRLLFVANRANAAALAVNFDRDVCIFETQQFRTARSKSAKQRDPNFPNPPESAHRSPVSRLREKRGDRFRFHQLARLVEVVVNDGLWINAARVVDERE